MRQRSLALTMAQLRRQGRGRATTLALAAQAMADRSTLVLMLLLATLGMVPSPGLPLGLVCGILVMWLSVARLIGRHEAPLPRALAERRLPAQVLEAALRRLIPLLRRVERRVAVRLPALATGPGDAVATLMICLQGLVLALPIPFGNVPPALSILALAGGLVWRDGVCVLAGHGLAVASFAIVGALAWGGLEMLAWTGITG